VIVERAEVRKLLAAVDAAGPAGQAVVVPLVAVLVILGLKMNVTILLRDNLILLYEKLNYLDKLTYSSSYSIKC
jgi:hypothetical protein